MSEEGRFRFWLFSCHSVGLEHFVVSEVPGLASFTMFPGETHFRCHVSPSKHFPRIALFFFFFKFFLKLMNLFLTALGLRCCAPAFSSCGERGLHFVAVRGLLIAGASCVVEHGL